MMNYEHLISLVEDMNSKMDGVVEAVGELHGQVKNLPTRDEFSELKTDVQTIKQVVTQQEQRLIKLEPA